MASHIRKGDEVVVTSGDYKGQIGKVVRVIKEKGRVVVQGAGIPGITKNVKPTRANPQGGRVEIDRSFHISNVSPSAGGKPTRVRFVTKDDGSKVRIAATTGEQIGDELRTARRAKQKQGS